MRFGKEIFVGACLCLLTLISKVQAAPEVMEGFLCCTLEIDGDWISDINLRSESGKVVKVGTTVKVLGFGRQRLKLSVEGKEVGLGNDYSRSMDLTSFRDRYVVTENPLQTLMAAPAEVQSLVHQRRVAPGMDRRFVIMSLGYPVASSTPDLSDKRWAYFFRDEESRFWVMFDDAGVVESIRGDEDVLAVVAPAMLSPERRAQASKGEPPCQINVYHATIQNWQSSREKVIVYLDDRSKGGLSLGETLCFNNLAPGRHTVSVRGTHMLIPSLWKGGEHVVDITPEDHPVFFRYQKAMAGLIATGAGVAPQSQEGFDVVTEAQWRGRL